MDCVVPLELGCSKGDAILIFRVKPSTTSAVQRLPSSSFGKWRKGDQWGERWANAGQLVLV